MSYETRVKCARSRTVKRKVLSSTEKKALTLDVKNGTMKDKDIAAKFGCSTKTVERARKTIQNKKPKSALTVKRALEMKQVTSMMIYYLETLERITGQIEADTDMKLDKKAEAIRENLIVTLNIHNSLAFTDVPSGQMDYTDTEVTILELILDMIPEEKREEFNAKISKLTETKDNPPDDNVQPDGRPEAGAIPEKPGPVRP